MGGHIVLRVRREGHEAVICVKDNGAGIPREMLDSVFDLFVQGRHTIDHADGGLGVGLTLVRALVQMHGGTVSVNSDGDGAGSEFIVRLPATTQAEPVPPQDQHASLTQPPGITVLIVEDNAESREMLCAMLRHAGFVCHDAPDGLSALRLA